MTALLDLAANSPFLFGLLVTASLLAGIALLVTGLRRLVAVQTRRDRAGAREIRLRATWEARARAVGLQPRDDESVDELMNRVMRARVRGAVADEIRAAVDHLPPEP